MNDKTTEELKQDAKQIAKILAEREASAKFEKLRAEAVKAVEDADASKLPAIIAASKGKIPGAKVKRIFKWDDALGKNRAVDGDLKFIEPAILMKGPAAKTPIL